MCPSGSKLTGGGVDNFSSGTTLADSPGGGSSWLAVAPADPTVDLPEDVVAYAVCYHPRGPVPGAQSTAAAAVAAAATSPAQSAPRLTVSQRDRLERFAAKR